MLIVSAGTGTDTHFIIPIPRLVVDMGCQFDAVWTTADTKLAAGMHVLVTEEVAYGTDGSTLFSPGKIFHLTGFSYNYDNSVVEVAI